MALVVLLATACSSLAPVKPRQRVALHFDARVGEQPFACGKSYDDQGANHSRITPSDLRFYVTAIELLDASGRATPLQLDQDGLWQYRDVVLLDFENGSGPCRNGNPGMHTVVGGTVPPGDYRALRFTVGLPFDLNHADTTLAPSPLNLTAMFWSWQAGYKFFKLDMITDGPARDRRNASPAPAGFPVHLGSTECKAVTRTSPATSCTNSNRVTVFLSPFDVERHVVSLDLASLLADSDIVKQTAGTAPGCMAAPDDADCTGVMGAFGLPFAGRPAGTQRVFSAR